ncbi:conserved hypothetical protein [Heliomicrobium modesticaldum Ice1]|uniref:DUF1858 domain-containing protein n=1 Tax=Heliobacterium modesticaldum (strain ATCC 51547 / Ice1) TaxID=498761 RepID=B0TFG2_HELMI|nr:DUF1858 domain-containing protein [Heliomicrobium modesticaldum]ABZ83061.1 conserved hypothetical protein [Heliomicrobium modesticaldum Ice1]
MKITETMGIGECVAKFPNTVPVFMSFGMSCLGCSAARFENIGQGARAHGIDVDKLIEELNKVVGKDDDACGCGCSCE